MFNLTRDDYNAVIRQRAEDLGDHMQRFGRHLADDHNPAIWNEAEKQLRTVDEFQHRMGEIHQLAHERDKLFPL